MPRTPGVWEAIGASVYSDQGEASENYCTEIVLNKYNTRSGDDTERRANARLIAAAPELLEACEAALNALCGPHASKGEDTPEGFAHKACLEAIRKAIGEE